MNGSEIMGINWIWLGLLIFVIVLDITTSSFTFSWLGIGFIVSFILGFFFDITIQVLVAVILGTISLLIGLKYTKKYMNKNIPQEKLLVGKYEGLQCEADFDLESNSQCRIKVNQVYWTAKNIGEPIKKGDTYTILKIENNKLIIKK